MTPTLYFAIFNGFFWGLVGRSYFDMPFKWAMTGTILTQVIVELIYHIAS